jgi:hypothetical protein
MYHIIMRGAKCSICINIGLTFFCFRCDDNFECMFVKQINRSSTYELELYFIVLIVKLVRIILVVYSAQLRQEQ